MIVVMKKGATKEQIDHMIERVESLGLKAHPIVGTERTVIAAIGEKREQTKQSLESGPGVAEVVPILAPYKVASREVKPEPTQVVGARHLKVGAGALGVIAGPCSVESEEQIVATARPSRRPARRPARRRVQAAHQPLQLPGAEGRRAEDAGRGPRGDRPGRGHRGDGDRGRRPGRRIRRRAADRRPQHAELPPAGSGGQTRRGRCCSNAAPAPRWTSCCWRPSTSSTTATRT